MNKSLLPFPDAVSRRSSRSGKAWTRRRLSPHSLPKGTLRLPLIFLLLLASSCWTFKRAVKKNQVLVDTTNTQQVRDSMMSRNFEFEYFSAKAKITLADDKGTRTFNASIRIKHDSAIWVSFQSVGIEGLRLLANKDSIYMIDRLNKKFYVYDYSYFNEYTSVEVDYQIFEELISGIPILFDEKKLKAKKEDSTYVLKNDGKKRTSFIQLNPDYTLLDVNLVDSTMGKSLKLKYKNYNRDNTKPFALEREFQLNDEQHTVVFVTFSKVKIDEPLKFPFNVKEKYE